MSEQWTLRRLAMGGVWSIVAPHRAARLNQVVAPQGLRAADCQFCEGNEHETQPEIAAVRRGGNAPDRPGWLIRVVPNRFPAVHDRAPAVPAETHPYEAIAARGVHEVIIESPDHHAGFGTFDGTQLATILGVYRSRLEALTARAGIKSVVLFRNEGTTAGASQEHPHAQLLGLPVVSGKLATEVAVATRHFWRRGGCLTCEMRERERQSGGRVVFETSAFTVITAFAPRFPYETWIIPKSHSHEFTAITPDQLSDLGSLLTRLLRALRSLLGIFPFNLMVQTAPRSRDSQVAQAYHWRIEILPRLTSPSGFEIDSGIFIVAVSPEQAAGELRRVFSGYLD